MREAQELAVACGNLVRRQRFQTIQAKVFAVKRPHNIAVNQRALEVDGSELAVLVIGARQVANEASGKGIARAGWVAHILQRIRWRGKKAAILAEQQRPIRPLLDD